jgi:hypothetical protein
MTAEVVVMNTSAVAMAADTAMSIPYDTGTKTYTRARKLLPLHEAEPVAVMVWDAPGYYSLPWEVIVGEFRKKETRVLNRLDEYVEAFFAFVDAEASRWAASDHEVALLAEVLDPEIELLQRLWNVRLNASDRPESQPEIAAAAAEIGRAFAAASRRQYLAADRWTGRQAVELGQLDSHVRDRFQAGASGLWSNLDGSVRRELVELGRERMVYLVGDEPGSSGLVFAGYGSNELFAQARVWRVNGRLADMTRRVERRRFGISPSLPSVIVPVAQEGVIHSFLNGLHPEVDLLVSDIVSNLAGQLGGEALAREIKEQFDQQVSRRGDEVARAVEFLPPGDLAVVAGDLIRMTALRNRATMTADTVGGPIDVILLSRSDGFRWVEPADGFRIERMGS